MLLSIFSTLYELAIGQNQDYPEYDEVVFSSVGWLTLFAAVLIAFLFYIVLGRWKPIWHHTSHWFITAFLTGMLGFAIAFILSKGELQITPDGYLIRFACFNLLYAIIYFFIASLLLKNFSIFSKRTPF
ncbi:MAG: hypothetical protein V4721_03280 [Bacteroidota bacterium]